MSRMTPPDMRSTAGAPVIVAEGLGSPASPSSARSPGLTFTAHHGDMLFIVGPGGSGKSAVFDVLSFHNAPVRGRLEMFGVDPARVPPKDRPTMRRRVGLVFQDQRLLPTLDVFGNVAIAARAADRRRRDYSDNVSQILAWVGLGGKETDSIQRLTEPERCRLCLARALINQPDVLLIDELTKCLSDDAAFSLLRLVSKVAVAGTAVVFLTRDAKLAEASGSATHHLSPWAVA